MSLLAELRGKRVLVLGFGREGRSTLAFLRERVPDADLAVADRRTPEQTSEQERAALAALPTESVSLGPDYLDAVEDADAIVRAPGLPPDAPALEAARSAGKRVTSLVNLFFDVAPGRIVGVTGTKGKSTTTNAIYAVLRDAGLDAVLGGNIGIPLLTCLDAAAETTTFVVELSSFQLSDLERSPHVAVVQNVVREHLDYHGTFEKYVAAKANIARRQTPDDYVVFNGGHEIPRAIAAQSPGAKLAFGLDRASDAACYVEGGWLVHYTDGAETPIMPVRDVPLAGRHNLLNVMPAIVVGRLLGVDSASIAASLRSLKALPHRLQLVHEWRGRRFYNDSLSTVPEAAMAALSALGGRPTVLLAGGHDRGQEWAALARAIVEADVTAVVLLPRGDRDLFTAVERAAAEAGTPSPTLLAAETMPEAVRCAIAASAPGGAVLLSPAAASFGAFRDYEDRGDQFRDAVIAACSAADGTPSPDGE
jgi:UDP-N-acetylmuramoylalanine--D-glutamate ligase